MPDVTPRLTGFDAAAAFAEDTLNSTPRRLSADLAFADADFAGGTLTADCMIDVLGPTVLYNGAVVGTQSGGQGTAITFSAPATAVDLVNGR